MTKTTFADCDKNIGATFDNVRGKLGGLKSDKYYTGTSQHGDWSLQNGWLNSTQDDSAVKIKFENFPEMSEFNNEEVIIKGFKDKNGNPIGIEIQDQGEKYGIAIVIKKGCKIAAADHVDDGGEGEDVETRAADQEYFYVDMNDGSDVVQFSRSEINGMVETQQGKTLVVWDNETEEWRSPTAMGFKAAGPPSASRSAASAPPSQGSSRPPAANAKPAAIPEGMEVTEIRYRETKQVVQYEPVTLEMVAMVNNNVDFDKAYVYLRNEVRKQIANCGT